MTTAIEHYDFRPGHDFGRHRCNCGICVVGAHWMVTHCGRCGAPKEVISWDDLCARCDTELEAEYGAETGTEGPEGPAQADPEGSPQGPVG